MTADLFRLDRYDLADLDDDALAALAADVAVEQHRRALDATDPDAVAEQGFRDGFPTPRSSRDPWLDGKVLICPGLLVERSRNSHDCTFVTVKHPFEDSPRWVWEAADLVHDEVRVVPTPKRTQRSVSLVAATEGLEVDVVESKMRGGQHEMQQARSYVVRSGQLVHVTTRARKPRDGHR